VRAALLGALVALVFAAPASAQTMFPAGSETGAGGLLFSLDLTDSGRDAMVSDDRWRVDTSRDAIRSGGRYRPAVWGRPPMYPWGWPRVPRPNEPAAPPG